MIIRSKFFYYLLAVINFCIPGCLCRTQKTKILKKARLRPDYYSILERVDYYNKICTKFTLSSPEFVKNFIFKSKKWGSTYFFDTLEIIKYFPLEQKFRYYFGDINHTLPQATIVKARPINKANENSILLKLNKYRHFIFVDDHLPFSQKENKLIFYSASTYLPHRIDFMQKFFDHEMCICRCFKKNPRIPDQWVAPKIKIEDHLKYKFILSLEGADVASNLKWIMSSNSLAVMPKPSCETWFMEGKLIPNYHYVLIKDDYSDVIERLNYYIDNPEEAEKIIKNAHDWVNQFKDQEKEKIISLLVVQKYFDYLA